MGIPRDFSFDRKGDCPMCRKPFSGCRHSCQTVEEHLREEAVRKVVRDELTKIRITF